MEIKVMKQEIKITLRVQMVYIPVVEAMTIHAAYFSYTSRNAKRRKLLLQLFAT